MYNIIHILYIYMRVVNMFGVVEYLCALYMYVVCAICMCDYIYIYIFIYEPGFKSKRVPYFLFFSLRSFFLCYPGEALEGPISTGVCIYSTMLIQITTCRYEKLLYYVYI